MLKFFNVLLLLILLHPFFASAQTEASNSCPELASNTSADPHFMALFSALFNAYKFEDKLNNLGIEILDSKEETRVLTTEKDSAVCQKLNERTKLSEIKFLDQETGQFIPEQYAIYFEMINHYFVFQTTYSPSGTVSDQTGTVPRGAVWVRVYGIKNLNFIGEFSL